MVNEQERKEAAEKLRAEESRFFQEVITFTIPEFRDFVFDVKDFCTYFKDEGKICPFIEADGDPKRKFKHLFNWDAQNCMWLCKYFIRQDLPSMAKRVVRVAPK